MLGQGSGRQGRVPPGRGLRAAPWRPCDWRVANMNRIGRADWNACAESTRLALPLQNAGIVVVVAVAANVSGVGENSHT